MSYEDEKVYTHKFVLRKDLSTTVCIYEWGNPL